MKILKRLLAAVVILVATAASAQIPAVCTGKVFNPITDADWNNLFPISIFGARINPTSNTTSPLMEAMPPVCVCPTIFGFPYEGIGVTFWQPMYVSEIESRAGCLNSLGGVNVMPAYAMLNSEQTVNNHRKSNEVNRMQVHWYEYPVFGLLEMMKSLICNAPSGFALAYVTEVDPLFQDDLWGAVFTPEAAIFANPVATAACAVDAVSSMFGFPMDALFWCAGTWGNIYPLAGNSSQSGDPFTMNNQIQAKFIARNHRMGLMWQTIGPTAICTSHINPIWVKSQYRYNQVGPIPRRGRAVTTGDNGKLYQFPPVTHIPTKEYTTNLIWQGQQCCVPVIP